MSTTTARRKILDVFCGIDWAEGHHDVALIDALFDVGANIEREGSSIDGGAPLSSAVGYGTAMDGSAALG